MEIIDPKVELLVQDEPIAHVAKCARVCYASDKTTDNEKLYESLIKRNHKSVFRHESHYYIILFSKSWHAKCMTLVMCPYLEIKFVQDIDKNHIYMATNGAFLKDNPIISQSLIQYEVDADTFDNTEIGHQMMRYTFCVTTQISTSRELNRVSPNAISEQSTRYVNLVNKGGAICKPHWLTDIDIERYYYGSPDVPYSISEYLDGCNNAFTVYESLVKDGMRPQDARGVLPLDTATKCVYTYSIKEWKNIIDLRYHGTTGAPHPNAKIIAGMIRDEINKLGYEL